MKKLLIGLLVLGSFSSFAESFNARVKTISVEKNSGRVTATVDAHSGFVTYVYNVTESELSLIRAAMIMNTEIHIARKRSRPNDNGSIVDRTITLRSESNE